MTNSAGIKLEHVTNLMMEDGYGPEDVIAHAEEYAELITGTKPSNTAVARVQAIGRSILNNVRKRK